MAEAADRPTAPPPPDGKGPAASAASARLRGRLRRAARLALAGLGVLLLACVFAAGFGLAWLWPRCDGKECPSVERLKEYKPPQASLVYDRDGGLIARLAPEQRIVVPISAVPEHVKGAFLSIEDKRFYEHGGIDWRRTAGAVIRDLKTLSAREGFSTITMQLARNVFPAHLTRARTLRRKLWEVVLARQIERHFSKDQILELYLNQIYLGDGRYGVEAAARNYFGRGVTAVTVAQAAVLAALPKAPAAYDPRRFPDAAKKRRNLVLEQMRLSGLITLSQEKSARRERLKLSPPEESGSSPWVEAWVRRELRDRFGPDADVMGLRVRTTLDSKLQAAADAELNKQLAAVEAGKLGRYRGPRCAGKKELEAPEKCLQGLVVAVHPQSGELLALVGGRDHDLSQFDRTTQARRQAGSTFKPFIYAAALQAGLPTTTVLGTGPEPADGDYTPAEGGLAPQGPLTMREALRTSSNKAAVELGQRVGLANVASMAQTLGIRTPIPNYPSTLLGAADVVPLELTLAYAAFVNGGQRVKPRLIASVDLVDGKQLWAAPVEREPAISPAVAFIMAELLQNVVEYGTGRGARASGPPNVLIAGKTGTTNKSQDAWFVGATADVVMTAWIGFDRPRPIAAGATGGRLAAPLVGRVLRDHYRRRPAPFPLSPPADVVNREVDVTTGKLATAQCPRESVVRDWFVASAAPTEECPLHRGGVGNFFDRFFGAVFGR